MSKNKWPFFEREVDRWEATCKGPKMHDLALTIAFLTGVLSLKYYQLIHYQKSNLISIPSLNSIASKNNWQSYKHWEVNRWDATFKDPKMHDLSLIIAFLTGVLEAGERERVMMIEETDGEFAYHKSMGISYAQHMNNVFEKYGKILPADDLYPVAHLCYYDMDGNLTQGDVTDMGELLAEVEPYDLKNYEWSGNSPLAVYSDYYPPSTDCLPNDGAIFYLTIYSKTDIWEPEIHYGGIYDNLELAMCHTPRLNRFLAEFKRLTLEFGGEWGNPDYPNSTYRDGIPLPVISNPDAIGQV
jgi:hypothetical protein